VNRLGGSILWRNRALLACITLAIFAGSLADAEARTRRKRSAFQVALQPFSMMRSAVHAVADPIVHNAPRAVRRVATAPVRIARTAARALPADQPRHEDANEDEYDAEDEEEEESAEYDDAPAASRHARIAQPVSYGEPIRVAYVVPRAKAAPAPRAEQVQDDDDYDSDSSADDGGSDEEEAPPFETRGSKPMVAGSRAVLRNGIASAPSHAPQSVKNAIWAANTLQRKPYVWGGGHGSFYDRGYDCSGTVSFALHGAGALAAPLPSSEFMRYGERGRGRWITIYSRRGHTFALIAGLRLDTTDFQNGGNSGPRWHLDGRDTRGYVARHPAGM